MTETTSIVALSVYRDVAESVQSILAGHPWNIAAVLDLQDPKYGYNPHNLAVTLRTLSPRPKCFIMGLAISEEMALEAEGVWREYVEECKIEGSYAWNLRERDWRKEIMDTLTEKFGN